MFTHCLFSNLKQKIQSLGFLSPKAKLDIKCHCIVVIILGEALCIATCRFDLSV